ncbi:hypothetical protein M8J77_014885 [Diaphorina citri]|nr:hypothetical protein M8J77_014885 [Diaphorina citri]
MEHLTNLEGKKVLLLWNSTARQEQMPSYMDSLRTKVGTNGAVQFENIDRLSLDDHTPSSYDVVLSGIMEPHTLIHTKDILSKIIKLVKPKGKVIVYQPVAPIEDTTDKLPTLDQFKSSLVLSGFSSIESPVDVTLNEDHTKQIQAALSHNAKVVVYQIQFEKPNFEIGASSKLSLGVPQDVAAVWKLDADDIAEDDLIDSDQLLSSDDLKKPDPASLKVCGTTGKRKACKNCSCGLAEELDQEAQNKQASADPAPKSSCGSCYLGDAFRCSTCPYLGMPAFKPGEKVSISDLQLKADV